MSDGTLAARSDRARWRDWLTTNAPGVLLSITVGMAATFVSNVYGGPTVLFALLLGMAFNFISAESSFAPGVSLSSRSILRVGVALLGGRITFGQIAGLGWQTMVGVACALTLTIVFGLVGAVLTGLPRRFGVLTAGAVAICGASAAAAIAAVLPRGETHERDTAFTIIGVTALSTLAMVLYPLLAALFHFTRAQTGVFLGGTIHDVAQVVGAGYSVSQESGDIATIIKLLRVALLVPSVLIISLMSRRVDVARESGNPPPLIPLFLVAFIGIVLLNSVYLIPTSVQNALGDTSRWCIVVAIAALGIKTSLVTLSRVGPKAVALMVAETVFLALFVLALIHVA
ncbi:MAG: putative sulfate exporter family transporter [Methylobacteriaceae bacterium]|nr:putative sulfate exporter family transporter [Methylobacteriaceae bacterium]